MEPQMLKYVCVCVCVRMTGIDKMQKSVQSDITEETMLL